MIRADRRTLPLLACLVLFAFALGCTDDDCAGGEADDDSPADDDDDAIDPNDCAACHQAQDQAWQHFSSHQALFSCDYCHEAVDLAPGSGHRATPGCYNCHSEQTHLPTYFDPDNFRLIACGTCHNPHGSSNLFLINETVLVAPTETAAVAFTNTSGRATGSYAGPPGAEGTGLCEVCHLGTRYYNAAGSGEDHFTAKCTDCHSHAVGFEPAP